MRLALAALLALAACTTPPPPEQPPSVELLDGRDAFRQLLADSAQPTVVHFWASWCAPCLEELPRLAAALPALRKDGARVLFVSVDAPEDRTGAVLPALEKAGVKGTTYLLTNTEQILISALLDPSWNGGLPASFVVRGGELKASFREPLKDVAPLAAAVRAAK